MGETNPRQADHPIDPIFLDRWSPRAFTGEAVRAVAPLQGGSFSLLPADS